MARLHAALVVSFEHPRLGDRLRLTGYVEVVDSREQAVVVVEVCVRANAVAIAVEAIDHQGRRFRCIATKMRMS